MGRLVAFRAAHMDGDEFLRAFAIFHDQLCQFDQQFRKGGFKQRRFCFTERDARLAGGK